MADIKTRNVIKGTIRTIDKASVASQRIKTSYAKTKQQAVESYSSDDNPVEYASGRMSETASRILHKALMRLRLQDARVQRQQRAC